MSSPAQPSGDIDLDAIEATQDIAERKQQPDEHDIDEQRTYERSKRQFDLQNETLFLNLRGRYGRSVLLFMWVYSAFVAIILVLEALPLAFFDLPTAVLVALVGGTAASVLGVVGTVAAGLFRIPQPSLDGSPSGIAEPPPSP